MRRALITAGCILVAAFASTACGITEFFTDGSIGEGEEHGNVWVWDTARVAVTGGYMLDLAVRDYAVVNMSGGQVGLQGASAGASGTLNILGGTVMGVVAARQTSELNIYGGALTSDLWIQDSSTANIEGGFLNDVIVYGGVLNLKGGTINGHLATTQPTEINVYGLNLDLNSSGGALGQGVLTGTWADGSDFSIDLVDNSASYMNLHIIPEPATLFLFGLGGLLLRRKR